MLLVGAIPRPHQQLDRVAHLLAKLVGHLLLVAGARRQQRLDRLLLAHAEEAAHVEQRGEGPEGQRLLQPERGVPGDEAGRLAARRVHQHPALPVGDEPQPHPRRVQQRHHPRRGRGHPAPTLQRALQLLPRREHADQQAGKTCQVFETWQVSRRQHPLRLQRLTMLRHRHRQRRPRRLRQRRHLSEHLVRHPQRLAQQPAHPRAVERWLLAPLLPLLERQPQLAAQVGVARAQPLREGAQQHRHRKKRAGDFQQREPFSVVAGNGHGASLSNGFNQSD